MWIRSIGARALAIIAPASIACASSSSSSPPSPATLTNAAFLDLYAPAACRLIFACDADGAAAKFSTEGQCAAEARAGMPAARGARASRCTASDASGCTRRLDNAWGCDHVVDDALTPPPECGCATP